MENSVEDVYVDPLFVGLTRPATMWGVPYHAFVVEFMATTLIFLAVGNPLYLLIAAPIHGILYLVSANDPGAFSSIFMWMKTIGRCRNSRFWGAASFSPVPTKKWRK
ncbi:conjugal transfer protein [Burkholderia diffusa]|uniref:type IV secretion system protein VirB3 n=1 Tax=Burkholderia diffusa TaxID=488732 RepID=UPI00075565C0|nr:type IV secretion system protein VirB3 [Burkholderia diffusa]KWF77583.1 conjugal transfer protein [Burkholderia diffusa]